jgi:hypothetical protein
MPEQSKENVKNNRPDEAIESAGPEWFRKEDEGDWRKATGRGQRLGCMIPADFSGLEFGIS